VRTGKVLAEDARGLRSGKHIRAVKVGDIPLPSLPKMVKELNEMKDVLLGREEPPVNLGLLTLQEVADSYFARASEWVIEILEREREGDITSSSALSKFRKGEVRAFLEMCKYAASLGSRRVSWEQLRWEQETSGRESAGF